MTTPEAVNAVSLKATGKVTTLTSTDAKWAKILAILNSYIDSWQNENGVDWNSLYDSAYSVGTVTATDAFDLDDEVRKISDTYGDSVVITQTGGAESEYTIVSADRLSQYSGNFCAQVGRTLKFAQAFTSDSPDFGGTITIPVYLYAEPLVGENDTVPVDIPRWLVIMASAEYVRNDITKQNQYGNLVAEANQLMQRMKDDNDGQLNEVYAPWSPDGSDW